MFATVPGGSGNAVKRSTPQLTKPNFATCSQINKSKLQFCLVEVVVLLQAKLNLPGASFKFAPGNSQSRELY